MKASSFNFHVRSRLGCLLAGVISAGLIGPRVQARESTPPTSIQRSVQPLAMVQRLVLPATDVQKERAADAKAGVPTPRRFAVPQRVKIMPETMGTWEELPEGRLWRLRIVSAGATDLNLGFTTFWLPAGATLHVISEDEPYFQGPYTARDNKAHNQLWTPVVPGEAAVIELFVPAGVARQPRIVLGQIGAGYRDLFHARKAGGSLNAEGTCENDVVCPIAAPWTNEIRSVGDYTIAGEWTCSGTLVADTARDLRSFFLTANHCGLDANNAPTVVVYWNYQSPTCGTHGPGSLAQNQSGATFRAAKYDVDFALIELDDMPDPGFKVYYSGWDRSGIAPGGCVGIHHPDCDVKAISFSYHPLTSVDSCIGTGGSDTHWQVIWSSGVTEPGSSGSGIWDPVTHRLIGTLSGGYSACDDPSGPDCYGKLAVAWASGSSAADRLQDWLDPWNTGATGMPGVDPLLVSAVRGAGASLLTESCLPTNGVIDPGEAVSVSFGLENAGGVAATNLVATLLATNGVILPGPSQNYGLLAGGGGAMFRSFTFTATGLCGQTITPTLQLQDGGRNLGAVTFSFVLGLPTPTTLFAQNFDGVVAPALPAGWTTSGDLIWYTTSDQADTPPNSVFVEDEGWITDNLLVSPTIALPSANTQLSFRHSYDMEDGFDGGVLEISINGGAFVDILSAGGSFETGGYAQTLPTDYGNPLGGRPAWSGYSAGFVTTTVDLPAAAAGQNIRLCWRLGTGDSYGATGWYVDTVSVLLKQFTCCHSLVVPVIVNPRFAGSNGLAFSYDALPGQTYFVETKTNLNSTVWMPLQTNAGDGSRKSFTNSTTDARQRYFRVRTQ